jgi:hypothetical protein
VIARPIEPPGGVVTVAGDRGVMLPVAGLIAYWERLPMSPVT